ncbi:response regulator aspartate phosphatase [Bacillus safensis]|uniref:response regulator aspartate phosphatase n=1 Tax=Bacillus safensis TaxID=561879 RepID=UPI00358E959B
MVTKNKISSPEMGNLLNKWRDRIRSGNKLTSEELKTKVTRVLSELKPKSDFTTELSNYYVLLDYCHSLMIGETPDNKEVVDMISKGDINATVDYYYYFFSGHYEFFRKQYVAAIAYYQKAEKLLSLISTGEDTFFAEFCYELAHAYYRIDQHLFSISYTTMARKIFHSTPNYQKEAVECGILLGANMYDMDLNSKAKDYYIDALEEATKQGYIRLLSKIHHNLGLIYWKMEEYDKAEEFLMKAYNDKNHMSSPYSVNTPYMLALIQYENSGEKADEWYNIALKYANDNNDDEYKIKVSLLYNVYQKFDVEKINHDLIELERMNLWPDVYAITKRISKFLEDAGDINSSFSFLKRALAAKEQIPKILEALK